MLGVRALLAALAIGVCAQAPAVAATWTQQPVPPVAGASATELLAVSCGAASDCVAVGDKTIFGHTRALAEHWNGTAWSVTASPAVPGAHNAGLLSVSCRTATWCMAVGFATGARGREHFLTERWNGAHWKRLATADPSPASPHHRLNGVACVGPRACFAVGEYGRERFNPAYSATFSAVALRWNGRRWSIAHVVRSKPGTTRTLSAVSCAFSAACLAVGALTPGSGEAVPAAYWWGGRSWRRLHPPNPAESSELLGVWCVSGSWCMAVGHQFVSRDQNALAERWNGHSWTVRVPPRPAFDGGAELGAVACRSASDCTAAGATGPVDPTGGLAEGWDGASWTIEPTPGGDGWPLAGIACGAGFCEAVGTHDSRAIAERLQ